MAPPRSPSSDIAFTASVKAIQSRLGSRATYEKLEEQGGWETLVTANLAAFIAQRDSAYLATANLEGQPYIQHRGGPKGFIRVLDEHTLGFADFAGNRQYITLGNLADNPRAFLFLMDYAARRRVKIWGRARVLEDDAALLARLMPSGYRARGERAIVFEVDAWDTNCRQHIPQKLDAPEVEAALKKAQSQIEELQAENARLRAEMAASGRG